MRRFPVFSFALILATAASMFVCMFPLTRALGKLAPEVDLGWFLVHEVVPRIATAILIVVLALLVHMRAPRLGWFLLALSPALVVIGDLLLMALPG